MTPYYDDGSCTIYHGDCREILPGLSGADMVLTDPPYGLGIGYGRTALGLRYIEGDEDGALMGWVAAAAAAVVADVAWIAVFCGYPQVGPLQATCEATGLTVKTVIVWDKAMPSLGMGIRNQHELIVLARKGMPAERFTGGNVWRTTREFGSPIHPHQKPLEILHRLVANYSPECGTVVDPFMGSGSTLRAAKNCNRRAIGIEIEERYCEIAAKRLAQEVLPLETPA